MDNSTTWEPTGPTTTSRQKAAAVALVAGSAAMCGTTIAGFSPPQNLFVLGLILVVAWLIDGGTDRFVGAGLVATAIGGGLLLGSALELSGGATEHAVVYPLVGLGFLIATRVNPSNALPAALTLLFVGASAANQNFGVSFNLGWEFVAILASWGVWAFVQATRRDETEHAAPSSSADGDVTPRVETGVGAGH